MFKNALVSCSDKSGLGDFIKPLFQKGTRIVSTGGTAKYLRDCGIQVVDVSEQTGFPEVMDGRVKTLHPHVHMALLARDEVNQDSEILKSYQLDPFDLVVGNLYPFEDEPGTDNIDIGGPSFLRAAAKSHDRITVVCDPADYPKILSSGKPNLEIRRKMAAKVFAHTSRYDSMIAAHFFTTEERLLNREFSLGGTHQQVLRYGENPQQKAVWCRGQSQNNGIHQARILQGKELSYNNLLDLDAAVTTVREFTDEKACVAVKHNSPCGVAWGKDGRMVARKALGSDPVSVFGGIISFNFEVDLEIAEMLNALFLECVIAPRFSLAALELFAKKKNVRILEWEKLGFKSETLSVRTILGGFLVQEVDQMKPVWDPNWKILGSEITPEIQKDLLGALKVCAHLKSNAIAIAKDGQTLGLGMGQVNRVDAVEHAIDRWKKHHSEITSGTVLASDAFFPFPDSIELIAKAGIRHIIQPGGSMRDQDVIAAAQKQDVTMVMTGQRHFLH